MWIMDIAAIACINDVANSTLILMHTILQTLRIRIRCLLPTLLKHFGGQGVYNVRTILLALKIVFYVTFFCRPF